MEQLQTWVKNMESKKDIRNRILAVRESMSEAEWAQKSEYIIEQLTSHPWFQEAEDVYCYVNYRNEVNTRDFIETCWRLGKKVAVPKICADEMRFYYIQNFADLNEGFRGILEPNILAPATKENALIIMPGAVFDIYRNRIGYGRGFYDRFLSNYKFSHTIALAFSNQIVSQIPTQSHDWKPEIVITEEKIYDDTYTK